MKSEDTRNLFLAIALSVLVMAAWQYFYAGPLYQREHQAQMQANQASDRAAKRGAAERAAATASPPGAPAAATPPGRAGRGEAAGTVSQALAASPRVIIDTPSVGGSINLKGGKIDDIVLKDYRETIDPKSPNVRLFSPPGAPDAYWAETGFVSPAGARRPVSTPVDRRRQDADPDATGDADLGQWRGPRLQAGRSRSTTNTCSRSPIRS